MRWIRDLSWSKKTGLAVLLVALLVVGGINVLGDGSSGGEKPGSDVLGNRLEETNEPSGSEPGGSGAAPGAPGSSGTAKGGGSGAAGSSESGGVGTAGKPGGPDTPPQRPTITKAPDDPTFDTSAQFKFVGSGAGFRCKLDGGTSALCNSGTANYNKLGIGEHTFQVTAFNSTAVSTPASHTWTILLRRDFEITGSLTQPFSPGTSQRLNLSLGNPYNFALRVLGVQVTVEDETTTDCIGSDNLDVLQDLAVEVVVPANSTKSLSQLLPPEQWPLLKMPNLVDTNQDDCKSTTFTLTYTGTATKS